MADYDAQPGRETPAQPDLSPVRLEADDVDLLAGLRGVAGIIAGARDVVEILKDVAHFAVHDDNAAESLTRPDPKRRAHCEAIEILVGMQQRGAGSHAGSGNQTIHGFTDGHASASRRAIQLPCKREIIKILQTQDREGAQMALD
jgi:hypothetical protein